MTFAQVIELGPVDIGHHRGVQLLPGTIDQYEALVNRLQLGP